MTKKIFALILLAYLVLVVACSASLSPIDDQSKIPQKGRPEVLSVPEAKSTISDIFGKTPKKDEELFNQGLNQITEQAIKQDEYSPARQTFETMLSNYPESRWRDVARVILRILEDADIYRNKFLSEQVETNRLANEKAKIIQDNEQLKKEHRLLNEKYQADLAALQQENEQLKKDIEQLKNLEIQLDRREKQLR